MFLITSKSTSPVKMFVSLCGVPIVERSFHKIYEDKDQNSFEYRLHPKDEPYENSDLHHLSGVVGVCVVNYDEVEKLIKKDNVIWKRVRRNVQKLHPKFSPFIEICI